MSNKTLDDFVFLCMLNGKYWTFWQLQSVIKEKTGKFYGEPTISASIRNLRKPDRRSKYGLPTFNEVIISRRIDGGKGNEYKFDICDEKLEKIRRNASGK